jgi:hypothetical protein
MEAVPGPRRHLPRPRHRAHPTLQRSHVADSGCQIGKIIGMGNIHTDRWIQNYNFLFGKKFTHQLSLLAFAEPARHHRRSDRRAGGPAVAPVRRRSTLPELHLVHTCSVLCI